MNRSAAFLAIALFLGGAVIFGPIFADDASQAALGKQQGEAKRFLWPRSQMEFAVRL